ncbi:unnamed protein product [Trichobilharzia regenti]|nr:unnamed protein product [Trichobilharzia regenti]
MLITVAYMKPFRNSTHHLSFAYASDQMKSYFVTGILSFELDDPVEKRSSSVRKLSLVECR